MPATICGISLWMSGSPPGMDTNGAQRILHRQPLLQDLLRIVDLAAAGAGEIALEQRLQHEHQRVALLAAQLLAHDVAGHAVLLNQWNTQNPAPVSYAGRGAARRPPRRGAGLGSRSLPHRPLRLQRLQRRPMIPPYPFPLHREPWGE